MGGAERGTPAFIRNSTGNRRNVNLLNPKP